MGIETEMKDGEWETKKEREKEEGRLSVWKIMAVSQLLLLQRVDESSAGCLGDSYFPPAADQFHLYKSPLKLLAVKIIYRSTESPVKQGLHFKYSEPDLVCP